MLWSRRLRPRLFLSATAIAFTLATSARAADGAVPPFVSGAVWFATQLIPSPLLAYGSGAVHPGMRWQITPLVLSFGVAAKPVRTFFVAPIARYGGSVELYVSPEYIGNAPNDATGWVARFGSRLYLPVAGKGESFAWSLGGSYYRASGGDGFAMELGAYWLFGLFGFTVTVAPQMAQREIISAFQIRYF